jgi:hypothetical protein
MARVEDRERWNDGEVLNVDQVNIELKSLVGEMNGRLDRDNLPSVDEGEFVADTFNKVMLVSGASYAITDASDPQHWHTVASGTLLCEDGRCQVEAVAVASTAWWCLGVRVDGRVVARSPVSDSVAGLTTLRAFGAPPVGPGTRRIELVVQVAPGLGVADTLTVGNHILWARSVVR